MKKLLFIILIFTTSFSYCQTAEEYYNTGNSKLRIEDYRGAIADYSLAIQLKSNFFEAFVNRGISKVDLKDYIGAIADFNIAIEINPYFTEAYYNRGSSKFLLNQKESACLDWSKAGELGDGSAYDLIKKYCN